MIGGSKDTDIRVDAQEQCIARGILLGVTDMAGSPESVAEARDYVRQKLGTGHPALDDVTLLTSELVTNSVIHSNSRNGGSVTLALADCHDFIHVDVVDSGGDTVPCVRDDVLAEGGRGLMLIDLLSQRWGVYEDDAGRTVWFEVAYTRGGDPGHGVFVPGNANRREPTEEQVRAVRETSATAGADRVTAGDEPLRRAAGGTRSALALRVTFGHSAGRTTPHGVSPRSLGDFREPVPGRVGEM